MARSYRDLLDAAMSLDFTKQGGDPIFWYTPEDSNLDAAATPIAPDSELGRRLEAERLEKARLLRGVPPEFQARLTGESMDQYGQRYGEHLREKNRQFREELDAKYAEGYKNPERLQLEEEWHANNPEPMSTSYVRKDEGSAYAPMTNFTPGSTVMVDGVRVPAVDLGDGQLRYRLGDVKRAQEAQDDARRLANHRQFVADDIAKYGHYNISDTSDQLTPAQYEARVARKRAESAVQDTVRARELRAQRLSARAGVPEEITDEMSDEARLRAMARNRQSAQRAAARDMITRRAQAQQNPLEYINRDDVDELPKTVAAQSMAAGRGGRGPFDVKIAEAEAGGDAAKIGVMNREVDARMEAIRQEAERAREDRQAQSEQFQARLDAENRARQQQHEMLMAKMAQEAADAERRFGLSSKEAEARYAALQEQMERGRADSARMMEELRQRAEAAAAERESREKMHAETMQADRERYGGQREQDQQKIDAALAQQKEAKELALREQRLGPLRQQYGPGVDALADGLFDDPTAEESLRKIAYDADDSVTGFYNSDAIRMDAILFRLGIQDPAVRSELVRQHGLNTMGAGSGGGRSGIVSNFVNWFSGAPQYPTRTPGS